MLKFFSLTVLGLLVLGMSATVAEAGRRHRGGCCYGGTMVAPAPVMDQSAAPAAERQAAAPQAYRSYSYQPDAAAPVYRSNYRYNVDNSTRGGNGSYFHDAGWKSH